jgi:LuxR family maltose regulon positive regulatory protein
MLYGRLGILYYESNQLDMSHQYHERGLVLNEQLALEFYLPIARGLSAPTLYALGETEKALAVLREAIQSTRGESMVDPTWFVAWEVHIRLKQGDLAFALRWAEDAGLSPDDEPQYLLLESHLVYARVLLADGRLSDGRRWLARLERFFKERGLFRPLISVMVLQSIVADESGDRCLAVDRLSRAVGVAAPEDYLRAFLDEDERIQALLADVRHVAPRFVDKIRFVDNILIQVSEPGRRRGAHAQPLLEPLSDREMQVLGLIDAGLSNRDIAETLVIATGTVKRHINNIYGKLGVHSRTQAVNKARELRLLEGED